VGTLSANRARVKCGRWQQAQSFGDDAAVWFHARRFTYGAVISACEEREQWQPALGLLGEAAVWSHVGAITYSAAINSCSTSSVAPLSSVLARRTGNDNRHLVFVLVVSESGVIPNAIGFDAAIIACEKGEQWRQAVGPLVVI
jgi:hypothetical protein